jgi:hypothetical protein
VENNCYFYVCINFFELQHAVLSVSFPLSDIYKRKLHVHMQWQQPVDGITIGMQWTLAHQVMAILAVNVFI